MTISGLPESAPSPSRWAPFVICDPEGRPDAIRARTLVEGVGDRLRTAAFAELQARDAFRWAAERFSDVAPALKRAWRALAVAEDKHLGWLLERMDELHQGVADRTVSDRLWRSLTACERPEEFAHLMARSEEFGRVAGERFEEVLAQQDPVSARIFGKIAAEEVEHIALAHRFFPGPSPLRRPPA